jgi:hypothetical protein
MRQVQSFLCIHISPRRSIHTRIPGGYCAVCTCAADDASKCNPLWQPSWPSGDPSTVSTVGDITPWGAGTEAQILSSIVGSNLCLDRFGPPHPGDSQPQHGEAGLVVWEHDAAQSRDVGAAVFRTVSPLPHARLCVTRTVRLTGDTLILSTTVRQAPGSPLSAKSVEWCEHTTIGGDFINGVDIAAGVDEAWNMPIGCGHRKLNRMASRCVGVH